MTDSLLLQTLAYVGPSIFGGVGILVGGLLLWLVVSALLDGNFARAVGFVALAVLALFSRRYLPALLDTNLTDPLWNRYSRRGLVIGSVFGALVLLGRRSCILWPRSRCSSLSGFRSFSPQRFRRVVMLTERWEHSSLTILRCRSKQSAHSGQFP